MEVSVRLPNTDTLLDCDSSSTYGGFGDPILRIRFVVHRYGGTTTVKAIGAAREAQQAAGAK